MSSQFQLLNLTQEELNNLSKEFEEKFQSAKNDHELDILNSEIDKILKSGSEEITKYINTNSKQFQQDISNLEVGRAKLTEAINLNDDLIKLFGNSNDLGNLLTIELKSLDKEISRLNEAKTFISNTKLLKNNINQCVYALEHGNWELAAKCIKTIRSEIPQDLITSDYATLVIPSTDIPEYPEVVLNKSIDQLTGIFETKFNESAEAKNIQDLTKFFQLFPLIGKEEIGLNCYSKFISQIITDTSRNLIKSISSNEMSKKPGIYSQISMQLFENISMMLSQHAPLIKKYYGSSYPDAINYVITKIQHQIDSQISLITDSFYDNHRIDKVLQDISIYKFPILEKRLQEQAEGLRSPRQSFEDDEVVTIVETGDYFNELAGIFNYWSLYCKFIAIRYFHKVPEPSNTSNGVVENGNGYKLEIPQIILESNFNKKIENKYLPAFESIFKFYFKRSLEKAIIIEELPGIDPLLLSTNNSIPEQPPCSSVVEDLSLVLNTCLRGIIDSGQMSSLKTFVVEGFKVIQSDFLNGYVIKELNENSPRYNSALTLTNPKTLASVLNNTLSPKNSRGSTPQPETSSMGFLKGATSAFGNVVGSTTNTIANTNTNNSRLINFVIYLNTIAISQDYFGRIVNNFTKDNCRYIKNSFPFNEDYGIIKNILNDELLNPFISITNRIIQEALINFYNQSIKNKLLSIISEFLSDTDESNYLIHSPSLINDTTLIFGFINNWRNLIRPYKQVFHHELIYNKLLKLIILNLANIVEKRLIAILKKFKINGLGFLKLEKDTSSFIAEVCDDHYELREKFVRVPQIILLVGMDDDEYEESLQEIDGEFSMNWVLTQQERKEFRKFRV
ncbi:conserved oligomeric Golgi complex subunit 4 [[Candida] jaroonii]|uniref:Conserved oligomeric Golgi complex subunit 4 n=1 Tax=[Candida] jaroonii TaxID=467808 RepID=A0ACA9YF85_9ASCO|nr:conserved oligomeric Golgi complex subunit 4 [[Candida] jaroonii]